MKRRIYYIKNNSTVLSNTFVSNSNFTALHKNTGCFRNRWPAVVLHCSVWLFGGRAWFPVSILLPLQEGFWRIWGTSKSPSVTQTTKTWFTGTSKSPKNFTHHGSRMEMGNCTWPPNHQILHSSTMGGQWFLKHPVYPYGVKLFRSILNLHVYVVRWQVK